MAQRRYASITLALVMATGLLSGCSGNSETEASETTVTATASGVAETAESMTESTDVSMTIEQNQLTVQSWKMDISHVASLTGKVLLGGQPVSGVEVNFGGKRNVKTSEDGSFEFTVDRSIPQTLPVSVVSADEAALAGKPVGLASKDALLATKSSVEVYYPIQVTEVKSASSLPDWVEVHARAVMDQGESFPTTKLTQYAIMGTVKDADGAPVKDAVVSFVRDRGEGWSKSKPSDADGSYILYYSPEEDEDLFYNVYVGDTKYSLPENRVYHFPEETSVRTDVTLPAEGNIIIDKPPTLVSQPAEGAVFWSLIVGLDLGKDVPYTITLLEEDGSFVVTLPKEAWDKSPTFFETRASRFLLDPISAGDTIESSEIPSPQPGDPTGIVPEPAP